MKVVIGLGNPGQQYERTRHNVGWLVLDTIAERAGLAGRHKARDAAVTVRGRHKGIDLVLVKPMTYMNDSGVAVRKVLAREHARLEDLLIVVDDFDLPFGRLRMRAEGSAGTHNGLRSIVAEMGTQKWARLRVGIGVGADGHGGSARDHVLTRFASDEERQLPMLLDAAADAVEVWAVDGPVRAADRFNAWRLPAAEATAPGADKGRADGPTTPGADKGRAGGPTAPGADKGRAGGPTAPGADKGRAGGPTTPGDRRPDDQGIVRTATGWRRLLERGSRGDPR